MDFYKLAISAITLLLVSACGSNMSCSIPSATSPDTCTEFDEGYTTATASATRRFSLVLACSDMGKYLLIE